MKIKQETHECIYGVLTNGKEITESLIPYNINYPRYKSDGKICIGSMKDYLDRRKNLATLYYYCPVCGEKLNFKRIKKAAKDYDLLHM